MGRPRGRGGRWRRGGRRQRTRSRVRVTRPARGSVPADPAWTDALADELLSWLREKRDILELMTFAGDTVRVTAFERHGLRHRRSSFWLTRPDSAGHARARCRGDPRRRRRAFWPGAGGQAGMGVAAQFDRVVAGGAARAARRGRARCGGVDVPVDDPPGFYSRRGAESTKAAWTRGRAGCHGNYIRTTGLIARPASASCAASSSWSRS